MKEKEKLYKALANQRRLQILVFLDKKKVATVDDIARHLKLSIKSTSKHLRVLAHAGFLDWEQRSSHHYYTLTDNYPEHLKLVLK